MATTPLAPRLAYQVPTFVAFKPDQEALLPGCWTPLAVGLRDLMEADSRPAHIASPALGGAFWSPKPLIKNEPVDMDLSVDGGNAVCPPLLAALGGPSAAAAPPLDIAPLTTPAQAEIVASGMGGLLLPIPSNVRQMDGMQLDDWLAASLAGSAHNSAANAMRPSSAATVPLAMVPTEAAVSPCTATAASIDDAVACAAAGCAGSSGGSPPPVASGGAVSASPRRRRSESVDAGCAAAVAYGEEEEEEEGEGGVPGEELTLEFLETNGYFDMPIQQAASALSVGVTTLKKVCRVNAIGRWPFRKRSSLNRLIEKTREYFATDPEQLKEALEALEAQRSVLQSQQGEDIPEQVKRYRQSIFKLDYKVKKIVKERRTHRGAAAAALAANDKAQTMRQLGVGTPHNHILGLLGLGGSSRDDAC